MLKVTPWYALRGSAEDSVSTVETELKNWENRVKLLAANERVVSNLLDAGDPGEFLARARELEESLVALERNSDRLRNLLHYGTALTNRGSQDYELLRRRCPTCGDDTSNFKTDKPFVIATVNGTTEIRCIGCAKFYWADSLSAPTKLDPPKASETVVKKLRYYRDVLESFFLAKKAAADYSASQSAIAILLEQSASSIRYFIHKTAREKDDAEQQATLGIIDAARKFNPIKANFAQFSTYASLWLRRRMQARKTAHCKPGIAIIKGEHKVINSVDNTDADNKSDRFHPGISTPDYELQVDMAEALAGLDDLTREIFVDHALHNVSINDLAEKHDCAVSKIRKTLGNAKEALGKKLIHHVQA